MPVPTAAVGAATPLARTKNAILLSLVAITVAVLATYVVIKAIKLYREQKHLQKKCGTPR